MIYLIRRNIAIIVFFLLISGIIIEVLPSKAQNIAEILPDLSDYTIYFSETYSEPSRFDRSETGVSRFASLLGLAGAQIKTLEWRNGIADDADLVVIPGPGDDLPVEDIVRLWSYMEQGGNLLLMTDPLDRRGRFDRVLTGDGLFAITWQDWGLRGNVDMLVRRDGLQTVDVVERDRDGNITFEFSGDVPVLALDFLTSSTPVDHPIIESVTSTVVEGDDSPANLSDFYFNGARSFEIDLSANGIITPLLFVSDAEIYGETDYQRYLDNGYSEYTLSEDIIREDILLALAFESINTNGRVVMIGDRDFVVNGGGFATSPSYGSSFVYPLNAQFMVNSVAWLLDSPLVGLSLPTPAATATATITPTATLTVTPSATPTQTD